MGYDILFKPQAETEHLCYGTLSAALFANDDIQPIYKDVDMAYRSNIVNNQSAHKFLFFDGYRQFVINYCVVSQIGWKNQGDGSLIRSSSPLQTINPAIGHSRYSW